MVATVLTATGVWAAIGFGLDEAFGTRPILFAIGAVVGHATGIYILWRKVTLKQTAPGERDRETGS